RHEEMSSRIWASSSLVGENARHSGELRELPLLSREMRSLRPPRSGEVICCLARILGESRDSGLGLGLYARANHGISSGTSRTISGKSRDPLPFSKSGLIMGDSCVGCISLFRIGA